MVQKKKQNSLLACVTFFRGNSYYFDGDAIATSIFVCALNKPTSLLLLYQQVRGEAPLLYIRGNHRRSHVKRKK
jgi:hypothetical protein